MLLNNKYQVKTLINSGSFGNVYLCVYKNRPYALKEELYTVSIKYEANVYKELKKSKNVCAMHDCFVYSNKFYLVLDYFETDLAKFKSHQYESCSAELCAYSITLKNIIKTLILALKDIHEMGYVHRDLKPSNICLNSKLEPYIIDFGLSKKIINSVGTNNASTKHISMKTIKAIIGSPNFVSLNVVNLFEPSRRDDIEAIIYILVYLFLPECFYLQYDAIDIYEKKKIENISALLKLVDIPNYDKIINMLKYIRKMTFTQTPNYEYIAANLFV